jgi:hypothetical protein
LYFPVFVFRDFSKILVAGRFLKTAKTRANIESLVAGQVAGHLQPYVHVKLMMCGKVKRLSL